MSACGGSLRTPKRATTLPHGAHWGTCRDCGKWQPLNLESVVKPHSADVPTPPGQRTAGDPS